MSIYNTRIFVFNILKNLKCDGNFYVRNKCAADLVYPLQNYCYLFIPKLNYSIGKKSDDPNWLSSLSTLDSHIDKPMFRIKKSTKKIVDNGLLYMEEISHLDEVRKAQEKVMYIKDKLKDSGDEKRRILFELSSIRQDIQRNHNEIARSSRGTETYVNLVKEEMNLLNRETIKQTEFNVSDETERQLFNDLTTAINDSYEKEKIHSNFIKILGLIGTLTASVITLIASAIGHFYHNTKFVVVAKDFKESVNKTISDEIGTLKTKIAIDIKSSSMKQEKMLNQLLEMQSKRIKETKQESWTNFFKRYASNIYCYFIPKKNS